MLAMSNYSSFSLDCPEGARYMPCHQPIIMITVMACIVISGATLVVFLLECLMLFSRDLYAQVLHTIR